MTQWTGCGECDCTFPCHNGEARCIRLTPKQEQEPIGWLDGDETLAEFMHRDLKEAHDRCGSATPREFTIPVYLAPPAAQPENGDIRALKYRIHELEGEVLGYKRMLEEAALKKLADLGQEIEQEPVAWLKEDWTGGHLNYETVYKGAFAAFPVYKHPPAAQRKPLTDEIVRLAGVALHEMPRPRTDWHSCAKLVCEAVVAHGIKEGT